MPAVPTTSHQSFARETGAALLLVAAAQWLFYAERLGATLGVFVLGWCAVLVASVPRLRRGAAAGALAAAAALALALVDDPGPLGWTLCWTALVSAALLSRLSFDDAASWAVRLASMAFLGVVDVARDAARVVGRRGAGGVSVASVAAVLALPLIGGALFLALFALANPVIAVAFASLSLPSAAEIALHLLFWSVVLVAVWPTLRPRAARLAGGMIRERRPLDLPVATVTLSLAAFNADADRPPPIARRRDRHGQHSRDRRWRRPANAARVVSGAGDRRRSGDCARGVRKAPPRPDAISAAQRVRAAGRGGDALGRSRGRRPRL